MCVSVYKLTLALEYLHVFGFFSSFFLDIVTVSTSFHTECYLAIQVQEAIEMSIAVIISALIVDQILSSPLPLLSLSLPPSLPLLLPSRGSTEALVAAARANGSALAGFPSRVRKGPPGVVP